MAKFMGKINKNYAVLLFVILVIIGIVSVYAKHSQAQIENYARYAVAQNAQAISDEVELYIESALSSIQLTSHLTTQSMSNGALDDANGVLNSLLEQTPFNFIEYINRAGVNYTDRGGRFNASNQIYYKEGIVGNTGIWINYSPKYSQEYLVDFYTPLYYNGKIAGVLNGTLGADTNMLPLLQTNFFGEDVIGILCDENNRVIASSIGDKRDLVLEDVLNRLNVDSDGKQTFLEHVTRKNSEVFAFLTEDGEGIACVTINKSTGWSIIQVVPPASFKIIMRHNTSGGYFTAGAITLMLLLYLMHIALNARRKHREQMKAKDQEVQSYEQILVATVSDTAKGIRRLELDSGMADRFDFESKQLKQTAIADWNAWIEKQRKFVHADDYPRVKEFSSLKNLRAMEKGVTYRVSYRSAEKHEGGYYKTYTTTASLIEMDGKKWAIMSTVDNTAAVINEMEQKRLLYLSETDLMTGIHNRGSGESKIKALLEANMAGLFCLLDADKFKSINDTFGHGAGDKVLISIANCLKESFRDSDIVMRLGGDEFAVFAQGITDKELAITRISGLFERIEKIDIPELGDYKVTISLGAAFRMVGDDLDFDTLYRNADSCTYESKKHAGNAYSFFEN